MLGAVGRDRDEPIRILAEARAARLEKNGLRSQLALEGLEELRARQRVARRAEAPLHLRAGGRVEHLSRVGAEGDSVALRARRADCLGGSERLERGDRVRPQRQGRPDLAEGARSLEHQGLDPRATERERSRDPGRARAHDHRPSLPREAHRDRC